MRPVNLLNRVTSTGPGQTIELARLATEAGISRGKMTFQAIGDTTNGAGTLSVDVEISNNGINWKTVGTISIALSTVAENDGFSIDAPWCFVRGNVTSITGTGAAASLIMGV